MDFNLPEEVELLREMVKAFARDHVQPGAARRDVAGEYPAEVVRKAAELGLCGIKVPESYGGAGAGMLAYVTAIEEIAAACASSAVTLAVINLAADCVAGFGTSEQKQRFLVPLCQGQMLGASFCLSEPHCGSDAAALRTTAARHGDHYVLNGTKQWITNGPQAGFFIVFARTSPDGGPRGISAFIIPAGTPGLTVGPLEHKMGLRGSSTVQVMLEDCRIPQSLRLGQEGQGFAIAMAGLDGGRLGVAAQSVGIARLALEEGIAYAKEHHAFGKPIAQHGAIQEFISDSATDLDAARLLVWRGAWLKDQGRAITAQASMAKVFATEAAGRIVDRMLQIHGGNGYVQGYVIERLYRDVRVTRIYEGTSEIQRLIIAREMLAQR